jgi:outer membrane PBP1 activator LpoA protein
MKWSRGILLAALYVSMFGCATAPTPTPPAPVEPVAAPAPAAQPSVETGAVAEPPPVVLTVAPAIDGATVEAHIALILPLNSPVFGKAAEAVQQGFVAAATMQRSPFPIRVYPANDEKIEIKALYQQAITTGAVAVAGPLTRNGVAALAENTSLSVPTLALNVIESKRTDQLYFFGLPGEQEARHVAHLAAKAGMLNAIVVRTDTYLSKRLALAFAERWKRGGGTLQPEIVYAGDPAPLRLLDTTPGNMVFLAAEVEPARLMRPYITTLLPVYATSQIYAGNANNMINYDLAEVRFVEMPWVIQPEHAAVMVYPRAVPPLTLDMERLYALGIDAYRMLQVIYKHDTLGALPLDGVTGKLYLNDHLLERDALPSVLRQGQGYALDSKNLPAQYQPPPVDESQPKK